MKKNVVAALIHNECKNDLLYNQSLRHSMNRIQSKSHRIGIYEINEVSLSCFGDKVHMDTSNGCGGLALGYQK